METGSYLLQVNIPDGWNDTVHTYYSIFDYSTNSMTWWDKSLDVVAGIPLKSLDKPLPTYDEVSTHYGSELGFFVPIIKPFDVRSQYPELFI